MLLSQWLSAKKPLSESRQWGGAGGWWWWLPNAAAAAADASLVTNETSCATSLFHTRTHKQLVPTAPSAARYLPPHRRHHHLPELKPNPTDGASQLDSARPPQ